MYRKTKGLGRLSAAAAGDVFRLRPLVLLKVYLKDNRWDRPTTQLFIGFYLVCFVEVTWFVRGWGA
jgi:hypothetical protein